MKIYRCTIYSAHEGAMLSWHASRREAERRLRHEQRERGEPAIGPEGVDAIDVPTDKAGLICWLNAHVDSDNG